MEAEGAGPVSQESQSQATPNGPARLADSGCMPPTTLQILETIVRMLTEIALLLSSLQAIVTVLAKLP